MSPGEQVEEEGESRHRELVLSILGPLVSFGPKQRKREA